MTDYLTPADVLAMHNDQIARYGGGEGLRDPGQLEAALFRPQTGYYPDVLAQAAALWESLSQNHAFVDGNKRTAFAAMSTFLLINDVMLTADAHDTWVFMSRLYETGGFRFEALDIWLRPNTRQIAARAE